MTEPDHYAIASDIAASQPEPMAPMNDVLLGMVHSQLAIVEALRAMAGAPDTQDADEFGEPFAEIRFYPNEDSWRIEVHMEQGMTGSQFAEMLRKVAQGFEDGSATRLQ